MKRILAEIRSLLRRPRPAASSSVTLPSAGRESFLAALRNESDIISSSFEESRELEAVVQELERHRPTEAIRRVRELLDCSHSDAHILVQEISRVLERIRHAPPR